MMHEITGTSRQPASLTIDELDRLSCSRRLTDMESQRLESALRSMAKRDGERKTKPWTRKEDRRLAAMLAKGVRAPQIAIVMGRTHRAILRRIYKLGGADGGNEAKSAGAIVKRRARWI